MNTCLVYSSYFELTMSYHALILITLNDIYSGTIMIVVGTSNFVSTHVQFQRASCSRVHPLYTQYQL